MALDHKPGALRRALSHPRLPKVKAERLCLAPTCLYAAPPPLPAGRLCRLQIRRQPAAAAAAYSDRYLRRGGESGWGGEDGRVTGQGCNRQRSLYLHYSGPGGASWRKHKSLDKGEQSLHGLETPSQQAPNFCNHFLPSQHGGLGTHPPSG